MYSYFQAVFYFQNTKLDKFNFKLIIMKNLSVILLLMFLTLLTSCSSDDPPTDPIINKIITTEDLIDMYSGEKRGTSTLTRVDGVISFEITTSNLIPGHVYQIACTIYNNPQNCVGPCDNDDFFENNVEAIGFVMAGKTVNSTSATFKGTLNENDLTSYNSLTFTDPDNGWGGLQDALTATITLDVRSKGPAQDGLALTQINNWSGGCTLNDWGITDPGSRVPEEIGECAWIQLSYHDAP